MKKYIHILDVLVYVKINDNDSIEFIDLKESDTGFPLRFYAIPRQGDIFFVDEKYYKVILVQFDAAKKNYSRPLFFAEGKVFVKEIGDYLSLREMMKKLIV